MLFGSFVFRFWFEVGVAFSARCLGRARNFFVYLGRETPSFWRSTLRFEVHCVQMAKADARVPSLCLTNVRHQLRGRRVKQSPQHGKTAARLRCLPPTRAAFRCAL